jgi:hypothetical protein
MPVNAATDMVRRIREHNVRQRTRPTVFGGRHVSSFKLEVVGRQAENPKAARIRLRVALVLHRVLEGLGRGPHRLWI